MHWWWNDGWSWWNGGLMTIGMIALLGFVFWAVVRSQGDMGPSPDELLAERFAAGETDSDEYERRLDVLRSAERAAP